MDLLPFQPQSHQHGGPPADADLAILCPIQGMLASKLPVCFKLTPLQDRYDPKQTYHDPNRTYHDVANALAQYPSLSPRTDVYSTLYHSMQRAANTLTPIVLQHTRMASQHSSSTSWVHSLSPSGARHTDFLSRFGFRIPTPESLRSSM